MATQSEIENIRLLQELSGGALDEQAAKAMLIKHQGNMDAAAHAVLDGDTAGAKDYSMPVMPQNFNKATNTGLQGVATRPNTPDNTPEITMGDKTVIDLTGEDDDLARAMQMSLEPQPEFKPSTRAPDPAWAMVPSNVPQAPAISQDDQSLSRAIEESLSVSFTEDKYEELPLERRIRMDDRPVALRTEEQPFIYTPLLLQALCYIPQFRQTIAAWRPASYSEGGRPDITSKSWPIWSFAELLTWMDLARISYLCISNTLSSLRYMKRFEPRDNLGDLSDELYSNVTMELEKALEAKAGHLLNEDHGLFHFRHGPARGPIYHGSLDPKYDKACVRVDIYGNHETADLSSCISRQLNLSVTASDDAAAESRLLRQESIYRWSDVVAFHLVRHQENTASTQGREKIPFRYPKHIYLDQFLRENVELTTQKLTEARAMNAALNDLIAKKDGLRTFQGNDVMKDLRAALYYYGNVACKDSDPGERKVKIHSDAQKLRKTLTRFENELEHIDTEGGKLKAQIAELFNDESLQKHRYDLRAVLVHDGLYGRSHIYSYIQRSGVWWKTVDHDVAEVSEETVLTDASGLHMNAGPYMLIYSRAMDYELEGKPEPSLYHQWPETLREMAKADNVTTLENLPAQVAEALKKQCRPQSPVRGDAEVKELLKAKYGAQ